MSVIDDYLERLSEIDDCLTSLNGLLLCNTFYYVCGIDVEMT